MSRDVARSLSLLFVFILIPGTCSVLVINACNCLAVILLEMDECFISHCLSSRQERVFGPIALWTIECLRTWKHYYCTEVKRITPYHASYIICPWNRHLSHTSECLFRYTFQQFTFSLLWQCDLYPSNKMNILLIYWKGKLISLKTKPVWSLRLSCVCFITGHSRYTEIYN